MLCLKVEKDTHVHMALHMHGDDKEAAYTLLSCVCNYDTYISLTIHATHQ